MIDNRTKLPLCRTFRKIPRFWLNKSINLQSRFLGFMEAVTVSVNFISFCVTIDQITCSVKHIQQHSRCKTISRTTAAIMCFSARVRRLRGSAAFGSNGISSRVGRSSAKFLALYYRSKRTYFRSSLATWTTFFYLRFTDRRCSSSLRYTSLWGLAFQSLWKYSSINDRLWLVLLIFVFVVKTFFNIFSIAINQQQ